MNIRLLFPLIFFLAAGLFSALLSSCQRETYWPGQEQYQQDDTYDPDQYSERPLEGKE